MILLNSYNNKSLNEMKQDREQRDVTRVSNLRNDFVNNVKLQEERFQIFSDHYKEVRFASKKGKLSKTVEDLVCQSTLDRWAFALDALEAQGFKQMNDEPIMKPFRDNLRKLKVQNISHDPEEKDLCGNLDKNEIRSVVETPARKLALAKIFASTKSKSLKEVALNVFDTLIKENSLWLPSAQYYKACTIASKAEHFSDRLDDVLKELLSVEKVLNEQINMLYSFAAIVCIFTPSRQSEFLRNNAYQKQKENDIFILELLKSSISFIKGGSCTIGQLEEFGLNRNGAKEVFKILDEKKWVQPCQLNSKKRIENFEGEVKKLADKYDISCQSVTDLHQSLENKALDEHKLLATIKDHLKIGKFEWTRKQFWEILIENDALLQSVDVIGVNKELCQILDDLYPLTNLEEERPEMYDTFLQPLAETRSDETILYFEKEKVKEVLGDSYKNLKKHFLKNSFAKLTTNNKVKNEIDKYFGKVGIRDLIDVGIASSSDVIPIFNNLAQSQTVEIDGSLKLTLHQWKSKKFPQHQEAINSLLRQKFLAKNVWISMTSGRRDAIEDLPIRPVQNFLNDLFESQLILPPTVLPDFSITRAKKDLLNLSRNIFKKDAFQTVLPDMKVRREILSILERRRPSHSKQKRVKAELKPIVEAIEEMEKDLDQSLSNINTELTLFRLAGFDEILLLNEVQWFRQAHIQKAVNTITPLTQIAIGVIVLAWFGASQVDQQISQRHLLRDYNDIVFALSANLARYNFSCNSSERKLNIFETKSYEPCLIFSTFTSMLTERNSLSNYQEPILQNFFVVFDASIIDCRNVIGLRQDPRNYLSCCGLQPKA